MLMGWIVEDNLGWFGLYKFLVGFKMRNGAWANFGMACSVGINC